MRSPRLLLVLLALVLVGLGLWATFLRSGIPKAMHGVVVRKEVRAEKHPGIDDVHLVTIDERVHHVDPHVMRHLEPGEEIEKAAWAWHLDARAGRLALRASHEAIGMAIAAPLLLVLVVVLLRRPSGRPEDA